MHKKLLFFCSVYTHFAPSCPHFYPIKKTLYIFATFLGLFDGFFTTQKFKHAV
jgi:hypothetical protein